ncbi:hypothetical protein FA95DRAFT_1411612 [Auriscalpium vulgare]|uniref:Uncharacterized protein n=1 Tax=Auriscalpium vulgare TaxID=40419 RepID=A0ACB8R199_9AGAM|nr:hypothetical protein FA95DRAFT_1411612 [Auriscalpium vulgare]
MEWREVPELEERASAQRRAASFQGRWDGLRRSFILIRILDHVRVDLDGPTRESEYFTPHRLSFLPGTHCDPHLSTTMVDTEVTSMFGTESTPGSDTESLSSTDSEPEEQLQWRREETDWLGDMADREFTERETAVGKVKKTEYSRTSIAGRITSAYEVRFKDPFVAESDAEYAARIKKSHRKPGDAPARVYGETKKQSVRRLAGAGTRIRAYVVNRSKQFLHKLKEKYQINALPPVTRRHSAWEAFNSAENPDKPAKDAKEDVSLYNKRVGADYRALTAAEIARYAALACREPEYDTRAEEQAKKAANLPLAIMQQLEHWHKETGWVGLFIAGGPVEGGAQNAHVYVATNLCTIAPLTPCS